MPGGDGFVQAYNAQIAVEPDFQWIVGQRVTQAANDKQQRQPTLEAIRQQAVQTPQEVMTDSGYCSEANLKYLEKKKIEGFIATDRESYRDRQQSGPRGPLPEGATRVDRMRQECGRLRRKRPFHHAIRVEAPQLRATTMANSDPSPSTRRRCKQKVGSRFAGGKVRRDGWNRASWLCVYNPRMASCAWRTTA
jgi:hypothetical protein